MNYYEHERLKRVERKKDNIYINRMDHPSCVSSFLHAIRDAINDGYELLHVHANQTRIFPNACTPICGIIDYYKAQNIQFTFHIPERSYLTKCGFANPFVLDAEDIRRLEFPFDKLFYYTDSAQVAALTHSYINALSHIAQCEKGVIDGIIWCINEVMDNVLTHGESGYGFVMSQYHANTNHIVFCVYDSGIGIYSSLKNSKHAPRTYLDSISLAIQEGVGDGKGQGNGLYGLNRIVEGNGGSLTITSGPASLMLLRNGERKTFDKLPVLNKRRNSTTVDFQLDITKEINIREAFSTIGGFDGFDIRIDDMIQENDMLLYDVVQNCIGTATREAGRFLRNDVFNILQRSTYPIIIDFTHVASASSSFIDEFISKLIVQFGIVRFNQYVRIKGMNEIIKHLCDRSTYMRIHAMWNDKDKNIDSFDHVIDG